MGMQIVAWSGRKCEGKAGASGRFVMALMPALEFYHRPCIGNGISWEFIFVLPIEYIPVDPCEKMENIRKSLLQAPTIP